MLRILRLSLLLLLLLLPSQVSAAQVLPQSTGTDYPGLDIQAEYGWDGFVDYQTCSSRNIRISAYKTQLHIFNHLCT